MSSEKVKTFLKKATFVINRLNASLFKKINERDTTYA